MVKTNPVDLYDNVIIKKLKEKLEQIVFESQIYEGLENVDMSELRKEVYASSYHPFSVSIINPSDDLIKCIEEYTMSKSRDPALFNPNISFVQIDLSKALEEADEDLSTEITANYKMGENGVYMHFFVDHQINNSDELVLKLKLFTYLIEGVTSKIKLIKSEETSEQ
ncbi:MAG: hypothetical protein JW791_03350 [Nanoarchaeota archaeon]|nr:hypothetical protein [Nanoarchaeota archaeon]